MRRPRAAYQRARPRSVQGPPDRASRASSITLLRLARLGRGGAVHGAHGALRVGCMAEAAAAGAQARGLEAGDTRGPRPACYPACCMLQTDLACPRPTAHGPRPTATARNRTGHCSLTTGWRPNLPPTRSGRSAPNCLTLATWADRVERRLATPRPVRGKTRAMGLPVPARATAHLLTILISVLDSPTSTCAILHLSSCPCFISLYPQQNNNPRALKHHVRGKHQGRRTVRHHHSIAEP